MSFFSISKSADLSPSKFLNCTPLYVLSPISSVSTLLPDVLLTILISVSIFTSIPSLFDNSEYVIDFSDIKDGLR